MLRVLAVALGVWFAYSWKIKERGAAAPDARGTAAPRGFYGLLALLVAAALLLEYLPVYWALRRGTVDLSAQGLADALPLHAFLVGALVGYLFADQTLADERAAALAARGGDGKPPSGPSVLRTAIANGGTAVLVLAAVVPPSGLAQVMGRLQNLEAAGVKLSFAAGGGSNLAEAIRTASPPRSQWTGNTPSGNGGFVPIRLDTMVELTHPARVVAGDPHAGVFRNPAGYISAELGPAPAVHPDRATAGHTRRVQRDRALLWQMEQADPDAEPPEAVQDRLRDLGRAQESFLALFAHHVGCLAGFIEATRDRRLVDYRNVHVVQELFVLAHTWSKYEKRIALDGSGAAGAGRAESAVRRLPQVPGNPGARARSGAAAMVAASGSATPAQAAAGAETPRQARVEGGGTATQLGVRMRTLYGHLVQFNYWIGDAMRGWVAGGSATPEEREASEICEKGRTALPATETVFKRLSGEEALLESSGFTPYLAIFVAQALSALDDHGAAVELLVDWLDDLDEVEAAARKNGRTGTERQTAWYRLQVLVEALVLQKLSENSSDSVPAGRPALRVLLDTVFPAALDKLVDAETMGAWRNGSNACRAADQRWKQGVALSYFSWVKEYLDLLQRDLADDHARLTAQDAQRAELIADINFDCFDWILVEQSKQRADPAALPAERAASRVEFTTTAAAIRMLGHQVGLSKEDHDKPLQRAARELQGAIDRLDASEDRSRSPNRSPGAGAMRRVMTPDPRKELLSNARAVLARIEALRKQL